MKPMPRHSHRILGGMEAPDLYARYQHHGMMIVVAAAAPHTDDEENRGTHHLSLVDNAYVDAGDPHLRMGMQCPKKESEDADVADVVQYIVAGEKQSNEDQRLIP